MSDDKPNVEPRALFKDPDKVISDLRGLCRFNISPDIAQLALLRIHEMLLDREVFQDANGNPRKARPRERIAAIKALCSIQTVILREEALIADIKGLTSSFSVEGRVALDLDKLYRDAGIIDVDPIQQRLDEERAKGGKASGNGNGKAGGNGSK